MTNGFLALRRGILEHLDDGRLTPLEFAAFVVILISADHRSAIWPGSGRILGELLGLSPSYARKILGALKRKGYVSTATPELAGGSRFRVTKYFGGAAHPGAGAAHPGAGAAHPGALAAHR